MVDIQAKRIIVHRDPREGLYRSVTAYGEDEIVTPLASPVGEFKVADCFGA